MKSAIIFTALILGATGEKSLPGHILLAKTISSQVASRVEELCKSEGILSDVLNPFATLLPPNIPDPDCFGPGSIPINITNPEPFLKIIGEVGVTTETKAYGFSKIYDDFNLNYQIITSALEISWDFGIPNIILDGSYSMNLTIDNGTATKELLGNDILNGTVDNVFLNITAKGKAPIFGNMSLDELEVDLGFKNFWLSGGDSATIGGEVIDWDNFSKEFQSYFDNFWTEETKAEINEMVRCSIDHVVNGCNIGEVIAGNTDCLKLDQLNPNCFPPPPEKTERSLKKGIVEIGNVEELQEFLKPKVVCKDFDYSTTTTSPTVSTSPVSTTSEPNGAILVKSGSILFHTFIFVLLSRFL